MGKIELDHTGAGSGITLSSDGTDLLLDGTAIGGGGGTALELYAENPVTPTTPTATGNNAVAIGSGAVASGLNALALGGSTDATGNYDFAAGFGAQATGGYSLALGLNSASSGQSSIAIGNNSVTAYAPHSTAIGVNSGYGGSQTATGSGAMALGGSRASGTDSFAAAIANNTSTYGATGANSVAIGDRSKATASRSTSLGGFNTVTGPSAAAIGQSLTSSGEGSFAAGMICIASGSYTQAFGNGANTDSIYGKFAKANGFFSNYADAQLGMFVLRHVTSDDTPSALRTSTTAASTTNQVILPNSSAYAFHGTIVARQKASDGTASAAWEVEGLIRREANAASTVLVNSALTVLDNTPAWGLALTADTTNGGLKIEVTGAAATKIRWVATINTSEVTYA